MKRFIIPAVVALCLLATGQQKASADFRFGIEGGFSLMLKGGHDRHQSYQYAPPPPVVTYNPYPMNHHVPHYAGGPYLETAPPETVEPGLKEGPPPKKTSMYGVQPASYPVQRASYFYTVPDYWYGN